MAKKTKATMVSVRMTPALVGRLDEIAEDEDLTRSQVIVQLLDRAVRSPRLKAAIVNRPEPGSRAVGCPQCPHASFKWDAGQGIWVCASPGCGRPAERRDK